MPGTAPLSFTKWFQHIGENRARKSESLFLVFWTALNLLQIYFTELTSDEGYYWFYAQHLQWGYYDHPPAVALLIKLGSAIFPGEFGVRFFSVVLSATGLWLFFSLLPDEHKQKTKTFWVLLAAPLLHYLTFLVFPDGPLIFFSLLFLVLYKRFLQKQNSANAVLLGLVIALMGYSKYHGVLVLLFTILANPKLLRSGLFYLSLLVAAFTFFPHLWWQYKEGFPTLKYHLSGRTGQWAFRHVGEYISQQIIAIGPGFIFLPFVCRANDVFERTLKAIIVGTFAFFLVSSCKAFVQFHWTSIALYPLLYFAVLYHNQPRKEKLFPWLVLPFAVLFFIARLLLMVPLIPATHAGEDYYHGRKAWAKEIAAVAGNKPVFMPGNLREASLYSFYSGKLGVTLYNRPEKKSQYELWGYEDSLQGKDVLYVAKNAFAGSSELMTKTGQRMFYTTISRFQSFYNGIVVKVALLPVQVSDTALRVSLEISNQRQTTVSFGGANGNEACRLMYSIEQNNHVVKTDSLQEFSIRDQVPSKENIQKELIVPIEDLPNGEYQLYFGIKWNVLPVAILPEGKALLVNR